MLNFIWDSTAHVGASLPMPICEFCNTLSSVALFCAEFENRAGQRIVMKIGGLLFIGEQ